VPAARPLSKTKRLVADVIAAGGRLVLSDETGGAGVNWRQRAYAAQRHGKVPVGKHLSVSRTSKGFEIVLHDGATGNELGAERGAGPGTANDGPALPGRASSRAQLKGRPANMQRRGRRGRRSRLPAARTAAFIAGLWSPGPLDTLRVPTVGERPPQNHVAVLNPLAVGRRDWFLRRAEEVATAAQRKMAAMTNGRASTLLPKLRHFWSTR